MEENLIFFAIGGLLLLTLFVNSVAEAYEQKQREKRIKILKIKQGLEEISELLDGLKSCNVSDAIRNLLANEIMARLQTIQSLDRHFRGIQVLIDEARADHENSSPINADLNSKDETGFKKKMIKLGRLIRVLNSHNWYSRVKSEQVKDHIKEIKLLRCEQIFQFYSDKARVETEQEKLMIAKEHYYYILHALKGSGINSHPRIIELTEQADFMLSQTNKMFSDNAKKMMREKSEEETHEDGASIINDNKEASTDKTAENVQSTP